MRMNPDFGYHASSSHNLNSTGETIDLVFIWPRRVVQHYSQSSDGSRTFPPGFRVSRYIQKCVWIPISSNTAQFCRISNFRSKDFGLGARTAIFPLRTTYSVVENRSEMDQMHSKLLGDACLKVWWRLRCSIQRVASVSNKVYYY